MATTYLSSPEGAAESPLKPVRTTMLATTGYEPETAHEPEAVHEPEMALPPETGATPYQSSAEIFSSRTCIYSTEASTEPLLTEDTIIATLPSHNSHAGHNSHASQDGGAGQYSHAGQHEHAGHEETYRYDETASSDASTVLFAGALFTDHDLDRIFNSMGSTMHAHNNTKELQTELYSNLPGDMNGTKELHDELASNLSAHMGTTSALHGKLSGNLTTDMSAGNELLHFSADTLVKFSDFYESWLLETVTTPMNTENLHVTLDNATARDMLVLEDVFASYSIFTSIATTFS